MPNWKKIVVSGSDASLSSLTTSGNISGSSTSTGSFGRIELPNGSATAPVYSFSGDTDAGFFLQSTDDIGVALAGAEEYRFALNGSNGDFHATGDVVAFSSTPSDIRLKTNISDIENPTDTIMKLRGVEFEWRDRKEHSMGFLAQEVERVLPNAIKEKELIGKDGKHKVMNYEAVIPVLVESIKELKSELEKLKKKTN